MTQTITAKTPTGTEYTATPTTPIKGFRGSRMRFEVEVPEKGVTFIGAYEKEKDAIMSMGKVKEFGRRVGLKVTDEVREFVLECERPVREAEAAEKARVEAVVAGIRRVNPATVESADGLYSYHHASPGSVAIESERTGLSDTTGSKVGRHWVYLQYGENDEAVSAELLKGARLFRQAVEVFERREEDDQREAMAKLLDEQEQRKEDEAFEKAEQTGERQVIRRYTTDCNSPHEECSTDIVTVWALPNGFGSKQTTRTHTW